MYSEISPKHYIDPQIFEEEQEKIFSKLWMFVGLANQLTQSDSFLTRKIAGVPIVVQNINGVIKAFENQCAHRQAPLQLEDYGKRALTCRYHGWSYDEKGKVKHIPHEAPLYKISNSDQGTLCLRQFALEIIGNLIFVNIAPNPMPIAQQFSEDFMGKIAEASSFFSSQLIHSSISGAYNWKLNFENVLDYNHVAYVHPRTFKPLLTSKVSAVPEVTQSSIDEATLSSLSFATQSPFSMEPQPWHSLVNRYKTNSDYYNFFIYPNVNFISLGGLVFLIQQYEPKSVNQTKVIFSLMTASEKQRIPALPAILWGHLKGEKRVLDEDIVLLEALQRNLHAKSRVAYHGAYEVQLQKVAKVYSRLMGKQE